MCQSLQSLPEKRYRISQIYEQYFENYVNSPDRKLPLTEKVFKAVNKTKACRTIKLGVVTYACDLCGTCSTITRACKSRFCARCGAGDTIQWANKLVTRILNFKHFHITCTLPKHLRLLSKMNGNKLYDLLFKVSGKVIRDCLEKKYKVLPGIISVLHTSGADLKYHPHVHMIVSGGGKVLGSEEEYRELESNFLEEQQVLGRRIKIAYEKALVKTYQEGELEVFRSIKTEEDLKKKLRSFGEKHWIVNIEKPLGDVHQIVGYVGRYTKRACMSEYKLVQIKDQIKFTYNDYKNSERGSKPKISLKSYEPVAFLDALLQHVPDARYKMVRYYGLYNSMYLNKIPKAYRLAEIDRKVIELWEDDDFEWGSFEKYRKALIQAGKPDPLWCYTCQQNMILANIEYDDSS